MFSIKKISMLGLLLALGIIIPSILGHLTGLGLVLLPIHFPVFIVGYIYGPTIGLIYGIILPIFSHLLTGMPSTLMLPILVIELLTYGLSIGLINKYTNYNIYIKIITSMILGRISRYILTYILIYYLSLIKYTYLLNILDTTIIGSIGIILQLLLLPRLFIIVKKYYDKY